MRGQRVSIVSVSLMIACVTTCICVAALRADPGRAEERIVRLAELEIDPEQLAAYKEALKDEIETSIRVEPGVVTLYAVSVKDHPERIRLFEIYRDAASYQAHLQSAHFKKYKQGTQQMVKSLTLVEVDPILLGSKLH